MFAVEGGFFMYIDIDGFTILLTILCLVIEFYLASEFYKVVQMKGYSETKYFWIAFLFSFAGYLLIIALPDKTQTAPQNNDTDSLPRL